MMNETHPIFESVSLVRGRDTNFRMMIRGLFNMYFGILRYGNISQGNGPDILPRVTRAKRHRCALLLDISQREYISITNVLYTRRKFYIR